MFEALEFGFTAPFPCHYQGDWPDGTWWAHCEEGDLWPVRPALFRLYPEAARDRAEPRASAGTAG